MATFSRSVRALLLRGVLRLSLLAVVLVVGWAVFQHVFVGPDSAMMRALTGGFPTTIDRVVDGDTVVATVGGERRRIRVLGIDTPETVKQGTPVQRCGPESSARARSWVRRHPQVRLVADPAAPDEDRYGRLLRYLEPTDGSADLSTTLVASGLARVKAYGQDLERLPELRSAQRRARRAGRGLWGSGCGAR